MIFFTPRKGHFSPPTASSAFFTSGTPFSHTRSDLRHDSGTNVINGLLIPSCIIRYRLDPIDSSSPAFFFHFIHWNWEIPVSEISEMPRWPTRQSVFSALFFFLHKNLSSLTIFRHPAPSPFIRTPYFFPLDVVFSAFLDFSVFGLLEKWRLLSQKNANIIKVVICFDPTVILLNCARKNILLYIKKILKKHFFHEYFPHLAENR